ncbi:MAG: DUF1294 domain-containing protein [Clostridiaceae bacterium]
MIKYLNFYFVLLNITGFLSMYIDKEKARTGKWRIKESTLLIIAVIGGSIGSYLGMKIFGHKTKHAKFKYGIPFIIIIQLIIYLYFSNNYISISKYSIKSRKIPAKFDGYKIVQISDLHNKVFPFNNNNLVKAIISENPDAVFITGDLIDSRKYDEDKAMLLIDEIKAIAPIYYVPGNNEACFGKFSSLEKKLIGSGVIVLRNNSVPVKRGEDKIIISGIDDPTFNRSGYGDFTTAKEEIEKIKKEDSYNILLSHRPELFQLYADEKIDLVFTGHAHGGQIILPILGGLIAPNQGFFPKYYKGIYSDTNTSMVVSRGLGNSIAPIRLFNLPELVIVKLESGK